MCSRRIIASFRSLTKLSHLWSSSATWPAPAIKPARTEWFKLESSKPGLFSWCICSIGMICMSNEPKMLLRELLAEVDCVFQGASAALPDGEDGMGRQSASGHSSRKFHLRVSKSIQAGWSCYVCCDVCVSAGMLASWSLTQKQTWGRTIRTSLIWTTRCRVTDFSPDCERLKACFQKE